MREDLHIPMHESQEQARVRTQDDHISNLIRQHYDKLEQIERYYNSGKMSYEVACRMLEGVPHASQA